MSVRNTNIPTKDGRKWVFELRYKTLKGEMKKYTSKKFKTKREADDEEKKFRMQHGSLQVYDMTIKNLYDNFFEYQQDRQMVYTL